MPLGHRCAGSRVQQNRPACAGQASVRHRLCGQPRPSGKKWSANVREAVRTVSICFSKFAHPLHIMRWKRSRTRSPKDSSRSIPSEIRWVTCLQVPVKSCMVGIRRTLYWESKDGWRCGTVAGCYNADVLTAPSGPPAIRSTCLDHHFGDRTMRVHQGRQTGGPAVHAHGRSSRVR